ncbi:hypothetical protein [Paenibacillus melissococcoides]|uniref:hypothetical protein n=1 Tax=Paenibacillus melissococcoides TaxID=2912268 RepID=UPI0021C29DB5|nr:hypothetical protein [Paenibacillus melissococcoides]
MAELIIDDARLHDRIADDAGIGQLPRLWLDAKLLAQLPHPVLRRLARLQTAITSRDWP